MTARRLTFINTADAWGLVAMVLHWALALLIFGQLVLGRVAEEARVSPQKLDLFVWHKSVGVTILCLVLLRLGWRVANRVPTPPATVAVWERYAARLGHLLLYLLMIAVPLTGWWISDTSRIPFRLYWRVPVPDLMDANPDMSEFAASLHETLTTLLIVVILVHVLAALRHHLILRDDTLLRMLPFGRARGD
jgi:cytochrome b561